MSGRQDMAEEVTQEVFLALLSAPGQYEAARGPMEAYLIGVARNRVRRHLRELGRAAPDEDLQRASFAHGDSLDREQDVARLRRAILALPVNYREVLVLCD